MSHVTAYTNNGIIFAVWFRSQLMTGSHNRRHKENSCTESGLTKLELIIYFYLDFTTRGKLSVLPCDKQLLQYGFETDKYPLDYNRFYGSEP